MISVFNALQRVDENTTKLDIVEQPVEECLDCVLGKDVYASMNMPPFRQSAMDGYAIDYESAAKMNGKLQVKGESKAGNNQVFFEKGTAMRVFTGAMVPDGADTVVIQEHVTREDNQMEIANFEQVTQGANIRPIGDEIKKEAVILPVGFVINPAAIGLLISLGVESIPVYRKPKLAILITGDELKEQGSNLQKGEIYESNSHTLSSALRNENLKASHIIRVKDDLNETIEAIANILEEVDVILSTGGVSVGDYDFIGKALNQLNAQEIFYKVKQKPGKPLYYGKLKNTTFYGLPGNPGSVLSCFYIYVLPALRKMQNKPFDLKIREAQLKNQISIKGDKVQFLKGMVVNGVVEILNKQSSSMLLSFARANCLVMLEPENPEYKKGEKVKIMDLPFNR